jgi:hypothetical protein
VLLCRLSTFVLKECQFDIAPADAINRPQY